MFCSILSYVHAFVAKGKKEGERRTVVNVTRNSLDKHL